MHYIYPDSSNYRVMQPLSTYLWVDQCSYKHNSRWILRSRKAIVGRRSYIWWQICRRSWFKRWNLGICPICCKIQHWRSKLCLGHFNSKFNWRLHCQYCSASWWKVYCSPYILGRQLYISNWLQWSLNHSTLIQLR